jgi:lipopolysaccharide export system permease protein
VKILDEQRYWSFIKAYVICYVSLVGLYVVIDAFSNMDEFSKRADSATEMFQIMSRYYFMDQGLYFKQLSVAIGMMAIVTVIESGKCRRGPAPGRDPAGITRRRSETDGDGS